MRFNSSYYNSYLGSTSVMVIWMNLIVAAFIIAIESVPHFHQKIQWPIFELQLGYAATIMFQYIKCIVLVATLVAYKRKQTLITWITFILMGEVVSTLCSVVWQMCRYLIGIIALRLITDETLAIATFEDISKYHFLVANEAVLVHLGFELCSVAVLWKYKIELQMKTRLKSNRNRVRQRKDDGSQEDETTVQLPPYDFYSIEAAMSKYVYFNV